MTSASTDNGQVLQEQTKHLLRSKFYVPAVRSNQVPRPRLVDSLNDGMAKKLILVSAPAGYGKTTLVTTWLKQAGTRCAWLSLDSEDNSPVRFLQYLLQAIQSSVPGIGDVLLDALQGVQPAEYEKLIDLLANELGSVPGQFVLVLDDFHLIGNETVVRLVLHLLDNLPDRKLLVLVTRIDPPLPLARLRVRDQLVDIRSEHLRFTSDEVASFLNDVMGLRLSAGDLAAMETRTEGWVAGLQLAALSMQGRADVHSFVTAFSGNHHHIIDYLAEEVLRVQPKNVVEFLLWTSILDQMCGPLCEYVVGGTESTVDAQAMLETIEKMNLFIVPLDNERRWYRYHHLFADVLRKRLRSQYPLLLRELHRRASTWFERNGLTFEAVQQAVAADDRDRATKLIEDNGCSLIMAGEVATLLAWIDTIEFSPEVHPWLAVQKGWALALTGNADRVEPVIRVPEQLLAPLEATPEIRILRGTVAAARAYCANARGDSPAAAKHARHALEQLPDSITFSQSIRSVATSILGDASWIDGSLDEAVRAYLEAIDIGRQAGSLSMVVIANSNLAEVLWEQGQLSRAADVYSRCLELAVRPNGQPSPLAGSIYIGLGRLSYEHNRLDEASHYINQGIDLCQRWGDVGVQTVGYALLARLEQTRGNVDESRNAVQNAEQLADEYRLSPRQSILAKSDLARTWLAQGNLEKVAQLIEKAGLTTEDVISYQREQEYVSLVRFLLARGDYVACLALSERLLKNAEASRRVGRATELLVLRSLVFQAKKEPDQALATLAKALSLGKPQGYARTFIDEGEPMERLLHSARARQIETEYVTALLSAGDTAAREAQAPPQLVSGPLTTREVEVLTLIADGFPNQEIADKLVISITTVKRHISNIYTKLDAGSRTQALAIARELKLLG